MAKLGRGVLQIRDQVSISADEFREFERAARLTFPDDVRIKLEQALGHYVMLRDIEEGSFDSRGVLDDINVVKRSISSLIKKLNQLQSRPGGRDAIQTIFHEVPGSTHARKEAEEFLTRLHALRAACGDAVQTVSEDKLSSTARSPELEAYEFLINEVAKIFEELGRKPTVYWKPFQEEEGSLFVDLLWELLRLAPQEYRPGTRRALAARVDRWRDKRLLEQKSSQKPSEK